MEIQNKITEIAFASMRGEYLHTWAVRQDMTEWWEFKVLFRRGLELGLVTNFKIILSLDENRLYIKYISKYILHILKISHCYFTIF